MVVDWLSLILSFIVPICISLIVGLGYLHQQWLNLGYEGAHVVLCNGEAVVLSCVAGYEFA